MGFFSGCPFLDNLLVTLFVLLDDPDLRTFNFLTICDISLAHADLCLCILDQQHSVLRNRSCGCYFSFFIDGESCISCNSVAFRCHGLTQCVLHTCLQTLDLMGFLSGCPFLNNLLFALGILFDDLNRCTFDFLTICNIGLAHFDFRLGILYQKNSVLGDRSCGLNLTVFIDGKCCISRDTVSIRCHGLFQRVFHAGLQAFNHVRLFTGNPLFNDFTFFKDLDCCAFELLAVCDIGLAHADFGLCILDQQYAILRNSSCRCYFSFFVDSESGI